MNRLTGHLLIAIPDLFDQNFHQTVVFVIQHDEEGASGVVLNRPSDTTIRDVWEEVSEATAEAVDPVYIGGPVQGPLIALHESLALAESSVIPGVFVSVSREQLNELVQQHDHQYRIFSGYSGWAPGQLENELDQGGWLTLPAKHDHVFASTDGLWKKVCDAVGSDILGHHLGKHLPDDPTLN